MPAGVAHKTFHGANGSAEHFLVVTAPADGTWAEQLHAVEARYAEALNGAGLAPESAVFRRIFVSDVLNQAEDVQRSSLAQDAPDSPVAVSIIQQQPLPRAKIALFAYHLSSPSPIAKRRLSHRHVLVESGGLSHLWSTRLCAEATTGPASAQAQTRQVFEELSQALAGQGGTMRDHCLRTWIYLKDVDVFYHGMVKARTELFAHHGLTDRTHYIASTGIEGACAHRYDVVAMDAYSVLGLAPEQVSYLNDFGRMCPTRDYQVTFERGTRVAYADRAHFFISGTASIDREGRVVHLNDVVAQLGRALENVQALLRAGGADLADMMYLLVYLRDPSDHQAVRAYLDDRLPELPAVILHGAVCRPEWLIEVEGVAVADLPHPALPSFA